MIRLLDKLNSFRTPKELLLKLSMLCKFAQRESCERLFILLLLKLSINILLPDNFRI